MGNFVTKAASVITPVVSAAGTIMQAVGGFREGEAAYDTGQYNAGVYQQQADAIDVKKKISKYQWDRLIRQLEGKTVVSVASSGYDLSGSFLAKMNDTLTQAFLDKQTEIYNLEVAKSQSLSAASEAIREGEARRDAARTSAISTLLTQGNRWYQKYGKRSTGTPAIAGQGGYGVNTPLGTVNMGTWSKLPGR